MAMQVYYSAPKGPGQEHSLKVQNKNLTTTSSLVS